MSLWTPSGEHEVPRPESASAPGSGRPGPGGAPSGGPPGDRAAPGAPGTGAGTPEDAARLEQVRRQLVEAPADVVVANHCYGLFELAAVYLSEQPPLLEQARLAIDALGCIVDGLGSRLGDAAPSLTDALSQLRLAYVQLDTAAKADTGAATRGGGAAGA